MSGLSLGLRAAAFSSARCSAKNIILSSVSRHPLSASPHLQTRTQQRPIRANAVQLLGVLQQQLSSSSREDLLVDVIQGQRAFSAARSVVATTPSQTLRLHALHLRDTQMPLSRRSELLLSCCCCCWGKGGSARQLSLGVWVCGGAGGHRADLKRPHRAPLCLCGDD